MNKENSAPGALKIRITGCRPWSWPASIVPVLFGTALSVYAGHPFHPLGFAGALPATAGLLLGRLAGL